MDFLRSISSRKLHYLGKPDLLLAKDRALLETWHAQTVFTAPSFKIAEELSRKRREDKDILYIVSTGKEGIHWSNVLSAYGMNYGVDFLDLTCLKHCLSQGANQDKLLVAYGNCQMHDYYDCLNRCPNFVDHYDSVYFKYKEYPRWQENQVEALLQVADVFIYTKENFDRKYRDLEKYVSSVNPNCVVIAIPCYSFRGIFPQTNPHVQEQVKFDIVQDIFNTFHREDLIFNALIEQGATVDNVLAKYRSADTFTTEEIQKLFNVSIKQLAMMDRVSAVKIHDYISDNIHKRRLFKDPVHMEDELVWFITRQLLTQLGCSGPKENIGGTIHYFSEIPIYPEVAEALDLKWWGPDSKCELRLAEGMLLVSPEEFIRRYYQFSHNAWQIKESLHILESDKENILELFTLH